MLHPNQRTRRGHIVAATDEIDPRQLISRVNGPTVYFILTGERIKIGFTASFGNRMRNYPDFQASSVLHLESGTLADERALHNRFAPFRAHGREYYAPAPHLLRYINTRRREVWNADPIVWDQIHMSRSSFTSPSLVRR